MPLSDTPDTSMASGGAASAAAGSSALGDITAGAGAIGVGLSLFGSLSESRIQGEEATVSKLENYDEQAIESQRQQQMVLSARRQNMQNLRNTQQARSRALAAGVNQGAGTGAYSSGVAGGEAGATAQGNVNNLGIAQNLQIGQSIFADTFDIDKLQTQMAGLQGQAATYAGYASLGSSITGASQSIGRVGSLGFPGTA